jgi:RimJ/RimL family protein N-acetyltransferase
MNKKNRITTTRLILRDYRESDFSGVHEYACDDETVKFMSWGPNSPKETRDFINLAISLAHLEPRVDFHFIIELKKNRKIIGGCGIHIREKRRDMALIGYTLNKHFWGQGFATESLGALLKFGFEQLDLTEIRATCDVRNIGSYRVMEKNNMRRKARMDKHLLQKGEWRDTYLYAILRRDYFSSKS